MHNNPRPEAYFDATKMHWNTTTMHAAGNSANPSLVDLRMNAFAVVALELRIATAAGVERWQRGAVVLVAAVVTVDVTVARPAQRYAAARRDAPELVHTA